MKKTIKYVEPTGYFRKETFDKYFGDKATEKKTTKTTPKKKTK